MHNWFINWWLPQLTWCGGALVCRRTGMAWTGNFAFLIIHSEVCYELHSLQPEHIPFEKKECALGKCFAYNYENFVCFLLVFPTRVVKFERKLKQIFFNHSQRDGNNVSENDRNYFKTIFKAFQSSYSYTTLCKLEVVLLLHYVYNFFYIITSKPLMWLDLCL